MPTEDQTPPDTGQRRLAKQSQLNGPRTERGQQVRAEDDAQRRRPRVGSLFSGAGLLDIGLHLAGFEHAWLCESDPWRRELLRARFPGAVVYDDIRTLRGQTAADADFEQRSQEHTSDDRLREQRTAVGRRPIEPSGVGGLVTADGRRLPGAPSTARSVAPGYATPVDLIAGGFPCKGASSAGKQNGFEHAETVLWHEMRRIIGELQPRVVLIENVANVLGMAASPGEPAGSLWGTVLGDLAALGFDARWDCVPAAAVGAPHLRDRVFCVATHPEREPVELRRGAGAVGAAPAGGGGASRQQRARSAAADRDQDAAADTDTDEQRRGNGEGTARSGIGSEGRRADASRVAVNWGEYAPAIGRWEAIQGAAPEPLVRRVDDGDPKLSRVRARVDRRRLSALGDGVHVYCAWLVGRYVMGLLQDEAVAA